MNDRLLVRALKKGLGTPSGRDFTRRVMERIEREACRKERRENRMLLAGAVLSSTGLIILAFVIVHTYADPEGFTSLQTTIGNIGSLLSGMFDDATSDASPRTGPFSDAGFLLAMWGYMAAVFLVLGCAGQLLSRKSR